MRRLRTALLLSPALAAACAGNPDRRTLKELRSVEPDMTEVQVENSLDQAMVGYKKFLEEAPESALTPEAMRRLADLKLEKEYGILGGEKTAELPAPKAAAREAAPHERPRTGAASARSESDADFERRAAAATGFGPEGYSAPLDLPDGGQAALAGPVDAIKLYDRILSNYPHYPHNDSVLYQKSRALDELGRVDEAVGVMERLIADYPDSKHIDEVQFRRAEYFFTRKKWLKAEESYSAIAKAGAGSEYYELALYKLGWTFYKQDLDEEALHEFIALLDHKVTTGYDFDHATDEDEERRIADTYRVISICFSNLGGANVVEQYFATNGSRGYEDRIYGHLAEFYFDKRRYQDAAATYGAFVDLHPLHRSAPRSSMRVVEIYEAGGFPKLVLESKKAFAAKYGLQSEYWRHFDVKETPEVVSYLKPTCRTWPVTTTRSTRMRGTRTRSRRTSTRRRAGTAPTSPRSPRTRARPPSTITSPSSARARGLRRCGAGVRAHGVRVSRARAGRRRRLRRDLRAPRERSGPAESSRPSPGARRSTARSSSSIASRVTSTPPRCWAQPSTTCTRCRSTRRRSPPRAS
jgi:TolA-binding protein